MDVVVIQEYTSEWVHSYKTERNFLESVFKDCNPRIEHVGSTSIGIDAKPIVDIAIGLESLELLNHVDFKVLAQSMWFRIQRKFEDEVVIAKFTDNTYRVKSHYIHVVENDSKRWREMVLFRDKLRENEALRDEYMALKKDLAAEFEEDVDGYTEAKRPLSYLL